MNIEDTINPVSRHALYQRGLHWQTVILQHVGEDPARSPDHRVLFVTLQSGAAAQSFDGMQQALHKWSARLNRSTVGPRWEKHASRKWRWAATFEEKPDSYDITPHWHLLMSPGPGVWTSNRDEWLDVKLPDGQVDRELGVDGKNRSIPMVAATMEHLWLQQMPYGGVHVGLVQDRRDLQLVTSYITKHLTGSVHTTPNEMARSQERLQLSQL